MPETNQLKSTIENLLKTIPSLVTKNGELKINKIKEEVENANPQILEVLLKNKSVKKQFFTPVLDSFVFKTRAFKEFLDFSFACNSYSKYLGKKIGLYIDEEELTDKTEVVLNFPFKDCVLEGGQTKEDGLDTFYKFNEKTGKYEDATCKRKEIFYNQILARDEIDNLFSPKAFTNAKIYDNDGEKTCTKLNRDAEINKKRGLDENTITDNLIIKGNNLLALHSLKEEFAGKVKLVYIDPPYNTGNDSFSYNDNFNHSSWLTFMKNRLEIAKELLKDDGAIVIQCDDNEQAYLKVLMDAIFGRENFVNCISVKMSPSSGVKRRFANIKFIKNKEQILVFKKEKIDLIPLNDEINVYDENYTIFFDGIDFIPLNEKLSSLKKYYEELPTNSYYFFDEIKKFIQQNKNNIYRRHSPSKWAEKNVKNSEKIFTRLKLNKSRNYIYKVYNPEDKKEFELLFDTKNGGYERLEPLVWKMNENDEITLLRGDFWDCGYEGDMGNVGKEGNVDFGKGKKTERLIKDIIFSATQPSDIVLDYHLGSGTTAAVAHKMNRQYIGVEQMDYIKTISVERLKKVIDGEQGGISKAVNWNPNTKEESGSFVYFELAQKNQKAVALIQNCSTYDELVLLFDELCKKYFLHYNVKINEFLEELKLPRFKELPLEKQKEMFCRMLDLNQLYVNYSDRNDKSNNLTKDDIDFTENFYSSLKEEK